MAGCWNRIGVRGDRSCVQLSAHVHCRNCPVYAEGARQLLDRPLEPLHRAEWTGRIGRTHESAPELQGSAVVFRIASEWLALSTAVFEEIMDVRPVHRLPHRRHDSVLGLVNVRGELRPCVSLGILLGIVAGSRPVSAAGRVAKRLLVLRGGQDIVVVPADEVHGIHRYDARGLRALPSTLSEAQRSHARGLLLWQDRPVAVLDEALLLQVIDRSLT